MKGTRTFTKIQTNIIKCTLRFDGEEKAGETFIQAGDLSAKANEDGEIAWYADGALLLQEGQSEFTKIAVMKYTTEGEEPVIRRVKTVDGERNFIDNLREVKDHEAYQGRLTFRFSEDESIHGFGQAEDGVFDYRGHTHYLYQHNMRIPMPMFLSSKGYGIYFDAECLLTFHDDEAYTGMYFDCVSSLTYYVIYGPDADRIIRGFRCLTGDAAMLPKWAFGFVQSKEQYYSAKELADTVRHYRDLKLPIDCIVQDWNSWEKDQWGNKHLDPARYSDMEERAKEIHDMHVHTMVSVWPNMNSGTADYEELLAAGHLLNDLATYDAFDEEARSIYWKQVKEGLFDRGFDSFWCDSTEPFSGPDWGGEIKREPWKRYQIVGEEHTKYLPRERANAYALEHARGIFENQRKTTEEKRVLNLTRSGYAGAQKYGAVVWSGDTYASWETLKRQITEGLNMAISGYPWWTLDIGGFFTVGEKWENRGCGCNTDPTPKWFWRGRYDDGVKDKGYCELYVRWFELGTFLPMFRSHGTDTPREIWNFGEPGTPFYDAIEKYLRLRYLFMPYIYSLAGQVRLNQSVMMRSLMFDFMDDKRSAAEHQEYLFGRALLVCPVTEPMYYEAKSTPLHKEKVWKCYLPSGTLWYDYWTGDCYKGVHSVTVRAELDRMPLFVRAGSILPLQQGLSYAQEKVETPLELHVYPGENGEFVYYDDSGDGYGYENGEYETVVISWSDRERKLTIGERSGSFPGMQTKRLIRIYLVNTLKYEGSYEGERMELVL